MGALKRRLNPCWRYNIFVESKEMDKAVDAYEVTGGFDAEP